MTKICTAYVANRTAPVSRVTHIDWSELSVRLGKVKTGDKDGPSWMPADIDIGPRTGERVKETTALVLDVEADAIKDKETGIKRIVGPDPIEPDAMAAKVALFGWACILHTSYTHHDPSIEPADQAHPRYRLVFRLSRPLKHAEIKQLGLYVAGLLGIADCIDKGCLEPARLYYLPRCPAERLGEFRHADIEGAPLDVDALLGALDHTVKGPNRLPYPGMQPMPGDPAATNDTARALLGCVTEGVIGDLRSALPFLQADDYAIWISTGHALKTIGEPGRSLWLEWSQTSDKYDPSEAAEKWESFDPTSTSYKVVFAAAQAAGWVNPKRGVAPSLAAGSDDEDIARLAALTPAEYDRIRKDEAKTRGIRVTTLDDQVKKARKGEDKGGLDFDDVEPWPHPVNPADLLHEISTTVRRFIICQPETADAAALWASMTWFMDVVQIAPLAVITAPEKRCGKSQLLFLLGKLVYRPLTASNISPAALFRSIDAWKPTLLVDEADSFMRDNEELRGLLNCGHTRDSAYIIRTVGEDFTPTRFNVWGAKALAGIGHLADTLMDRAITLELRRKLPHESVHRLRHAELGLFDDLASKLARFAEDQREAVRSARPPLPDALHDRAQDNWEPLLAIADVAGGSWPELARKAALNLSGEVSPTMSIGTELLADIQEVFEHKRVTKISTVGLIGALCDDEEKVWATYNRGKQVSSRQIAKRLNDFGIKSKNLRLEFNQAKGFDLEQFQEAFARYLSPAPEIASHPSQSEETAPTRFSGGTDKYPATVATKQSVPPENPPILDWDGWTVKKPEVTKNHPQRIIEVLI